MFRRSKTAVRCLLSLILIVPFVFRERSNILEIYPAVLLPAGDDVVTASDGIVVFRSSELVAIDQNGQEEILDPKAFFGRIPVQYWTPIARHEFGLKDEERKSATLGAWTVSATVSSQASSQQQQEVQCWMRQRLLELNRPKVNTIRVRYLKVFFDVESQTEVKREVTTTFDVEIDR